MRELIRAKRTTKHALNVGKDTLKFARQMKRADNKTRLKTTGKLLGLITLGLSKWFVREMWRGTVSTPSTYKRVIPVSGEVEEVCCRTGKVVRVYDDD